MANKLYKVTTECGQTRYAAGTTREEAFKHYATAHPASVVISIELLRY